MAKQALESLDRPHYIIDVDGKEDAYCLMKDIEGHENDNVIISVRRNDLDNAPFVNVLKGLLDREETLYLTPTKSASVWFTGNIILTTEELNEASESDRALKSRFVVIDIAEFYAKVKQ